MRVSILYLFAIAPTVALVVAGCEKEQSEVLPVVRAIKTYTVNEIASGQNRKFAGQVSATDSSTLSFQVGGNVKELRVKQGDTVAHGQVLGVVDKEFYQIDVQSAEAEREKARAKLTRARQEYQRQETLQKQGWSSEARLERHLADRKAAKSQLDYAISKLSLAKRNLVLTELKAPYAGKISRKYIDAFVEVRKGQPVYDIEASGALEARFDIPETIISRIALGMPVLVEFPTARGKVLRARITEIGSSAGTANAYPAKAGLDNPPPEVRSGMTVEVNMLLKEAGAETSFLVPLAAVAPADTPGQGYAFVYSAETKTVKKTLIKGKGATDNFVHVYEGIKAGDIVAAAGVTFLNDGQKVKLMQSQTLNALGAPTSAQ